MTPTLAIVVLAVLAQTADPTFNWPNLVLQLPIAAIAIWFTVRADRRAESALKGEREANARERETAQRALPIVVECTETMKDVVSVMQGTYERVQRSPMPLPTGAVEDLVARLTDVASKLERDGR